MCGVSVMKILCADGTEYKAPEKSSAGMWALTAVCFAGLAVGISVLLWNQIPKSSPPSPVRVSDVTGAFPTYAPPPDTGFTRIVTSNGVWNIKYTTAAKLSEVGALAQTNMETHEIWLAFNTPLAARQLNMLHEVTHIALYIQGGADNSLLQYGAEETFVHPSAIGLFDIIRKNPELADWLMKP